MLSNKCINSTKYLTGGRRVWDACVIRLLRNVSLYKVMILIRVSDIAQQKMTSPVRIF